MATEHHSCSVPGCHRPAGVPGTSKEYCSSHYMRLRRHGTPLGGRTPNGEAVAWLKGHVGYSGDECLMWPFRVGNSDGYGRVEYEGKSWVASRLMCLWKNGDPPSPNMDAAHSCGKGHEGCVNPVHLAWSTRSKNHADKVRHGTATRGEKSPRAKLTEADVRKIRSLRGTASQSEIARQFNVSRSSVLDILRGRNWGWLK